MDLIELKNEDIGLFKKQIQKTFQKAYESNYGPYDNLALPDEELEESFSKEGCHAYNVVDENEIVGGVIVNINEKTNCNKLDFLFVNSDIQGKGLGQAIWREIESKFPDTKVWETTTPYHDKRNINFYVNKLGFQIVEYYNDYHPNLENPIENYALREGLFRFEKRID